MKKRLWILFLGFFFLALAVLAAPTQVNAEQTITFHVPLKLNNWPEGITTGAYVLVYNEEKTAIVGQGFTLVTPQNGAYNGTVTVQVKGEQTGMGSALFMARYWAACIIFVNAPLYDPSTQQLAKYFDTSKPTVPFLTGDLNSPGLNTNLIHQLSIPKKLPGLP